MGLCGSTTVSSQSRDVGKEYRDTLLAQMQAQRGIGPFAQVGALPDLERDTRPAYVDLDLQTLQRMLKGSDEQAGLIDIYNQDIYPALSQAERTAKLGRAETDQQILDRYGESTTEGIRRASGNAEIMSALRNQAQEELAADGQLTTADRREYEQTARAALNDRGLGQGNRGAFMEALQVGAGRENRRRQQQAFAQQVAGQLQATGGDPFLALTGRPAQTLGLGTQFGQQAYGASQNLGPQLFNPESAYAADAYNSNLQATNAANLATASNTAARNAATIGAIGQAAGGALGGGMCKCWVAREVYGEENPKWRIFRHWLLTMAPERFRQAYIRRGEVFAEFLRGKEALKARVRAWMDARCRELETWNLKPGT